MSGILLPQSYCCRMHRNAPHRDKNSNIFFWELAPSPDPSPLGGDTPSPNPTPGPRSPTLDPILTIPVHGTFGDRNCSFGSIVQTNRHSHR